jgi:uncharacterized membrane protein
MSETRPQDKRPNNPTGIREPMLDENQQRLLRGLREHGARIQDLAKLFGVSEATVSRMCRKAENNERRNP